MGESCLRKEILQLCSHAEVSVLNSLSVVSLGLPSLQLQNVCLALKMWLFSVGFCQQVTLFEFPCERGASAALGAAACAGELVMRGKGEGFLGARVPWRRLVQGVCFSV